MRYEFSAPPVTCDCTVCTACVLGITSMCKRVACKTNGQFHGCSCEAAGHETCRGVL